MTPKIGIYNVSVRCKTAHSDIDIQVWLPSWAAKLMPKRIAFGESLEVFFNDVSRPESDGSRGLQQQPCPEALGRGYVGCPCRQEGAGCPFAGQRAQAGFSPSPLKTAKGYLWGRSLLAWRTWRL